jgi:hypothetical protein
MRMSRRTALLLPTKKKTQGTVLVVVSSTIDPSQNMPIGQTLRDTHLYIISVREARGAEGRALLIRRLSGVYIDKIDLQEITTNSINKLTNLILPQPSTTTYLWMSIS